jgi:single-strand DNA-binding protein
MAAFNRVTLVGNLTRDPETRTMDGFNHSSLTITEFGLAVSRKYRTSAGEDREEVLFIDCTAFGKRAETLGQFARKGRLMLIEGRLKLDTWEEKTSGAKRSKISVVVENFQFLGRDAATADQRPANGVGLQQTFRKEFEKQGNEKRDDTQKENSRQSDAPARASRKPARRPEPAAVAIKDDDIPF